MTTRGASRSAMPGSTHCLPHGVLIVEAVPWWLSHVLRLHGRERRDDAEDGRKEGMRRERMSTGPCISRSSRPHCQAALSNLNILCYFAPSAAENHNYRPYLHAYSQRRILGQDTATWPFMTFSAHLLMHSNSSRPCHSPQTVGTREPE